MLDARSASVGIPAPARASRIHPVQRKHLLLLTAEHGIVQQAIGAEPDPSRGYATDDVARALEVDLLHARVLGWDAVAESALRSLRFLEEAFDPASGRVRGVRAIDGSWTAPPASNDSAGRTLLALSAVIVEAPEPTVTARADALFDLVLPQAMRVRSPRAQAAVVLACAASPEPGRRTVLRTLGTDLHARFRSYARPGWPWPEPELSAENAILPRTLIVAGAALGATTMLAIGLQVLDWLIDIQTSPGGNLSPIGTGGWPYGETRTRFDQVPLEATSLLLACEAAFAVTGKPMYATAMARSYAWFLGGNDLRARIADPSTGACRDGLTATGVQPDQGAEATLMWLTALEHMRANRARVAAVAAG